MSDAGFFSINAMQLIERLLAEGANINKIRGALHTSEGVWYKDDAIVLAAAELGKALPKTNTGGARTEAVSIVRLHQPKRVVADNVRLVKPGTHKVPVGGYRMGKSDA